MKFDPDPIQTSSKKIFETETSLDHENSSDSICHLQKSSDCDGYASAIFVAINPTLKTEDQIVKLRRLGLMNPMRPTISNLTMNIVV